MKIVFLLLGCASSLYGSQGQTPWNRETAQGFPVYDGKLEITEGFGAYLDFCLRPNTKNFDNGGGTHDYNSEFLKIYKGVTNIVYDPFQRTQANNEQVLEEVAKHDFDTSTSNSVLNVIDLQEKRLEHIALSCAALKDSGIAYFKVWQGNGSHVAERKEDSYQSNRPAAAYQAEVEAIFGQGNVVVDSQRHMLIAYKNRGCLTLN
ncbi:MAG: hypothetical protein JSR46_01885 [Verrucomicrobia bacterium]|nr:hypothetical protein [Verrucomicrobiota bacterium]